LRPSTHIVGGGSGAVLEKVASRPRALRRASALAGMTVAARLANTPPEEKPR